MPDGWVRLRENTTWFSGSDRRMVTSEIQEAGERADIDVDTDSMSGETKAVGLRFRYTWNISLENGRHRLSEKVFVEKLWFDTIRFALLCGGLGLLMIAVGPEGSSTRYPFVQRLGVVFLCTSLFCSAMVSYSDWLHPSIVTEIRKAREEYSVSHPFFIPIALLFFVAFPAAASVLLGIETLSVVLVLVYLGVLGILSTDRRAFAHLDIDDSRFSGVLGPVSRNELSPSTIQQVAEKGPSLVVLYLIAAIPSVGPAVLLVFGKKWLLSPLVLLIGGTMLMVVSMFQLWVLLKFTSRSAVDVYFEIDRGEAWTGTGRRRAGWLGATFLTSGLHVGLLAAVILSYWPVFGNPVRYWEYFGFILVLVSPLLYFVCGLIYQVVHWAKEKLELLVYSSPIERNFSTSASVLSAGSNLKSPVSLSTGFTDYIFLPEEFLPGEDGVELTDKELEAIVAHEESHIKNRESILLFVLPILSAILFTGQNIVFSLFNFREREHQADEYASEKIGEDAIVSALQKVRYQVENDEAELTWWQEHFGLFYGTFAQSKAHPSISERISRIRERE